MAASEQERCKLAAEKLRDLGWAAAVSATGRSVEVSASAAERLIRLSRPSYRLPTIVQEDSNHG
jgi:hypothetical protein